MSTGVELIDRLRSALDARVGFWDSVDTALAGIGLDENYVRDLSPVDLTTHQPKHIKDNCWGMMEFAPDELALLNSPLLQRLRKIKQLGFTYLTYPTGDHSRFVHTLGVAYVVRRFIQAVCQSAQRYTKFRAGDAEYRYFDLQKDDNASLRRALMHAALLHDVGHFAFSHAGEAAIKGCADRVLIGGIPLLDFQSIFAELKIKSDLSECLSMALCLSPRFTAFYSKLVAASPRQRINEVACLIGGIAPHPNYGGLANIVSGQAIDADKIDYINRDAKACGIPVGIDISRIFLNSCLVDLTPEQAKALSGKSKGSVSSGVHFVVNSAGIDTYNEINEAKTSLYERVYLHQFTRSAEQLFAWGVRRRLGDKKFDALDTFSLGDIETLNWLCKSQRSATVGARLLNRRMPKRAIVLFRDACGPFYPISMLLASATEQFAKLEAADSDINRFGPWRFWESISPKDSEEARIVRQRVIVELQEGALEARRILDKAFAQSEMKATDVYVGFAPRHEFKPAREVLVRQKSSLGKSTQWTRSEELAAAVSVGRALDYVFADEEWLPYVRAASARVFYRPPTRHRDQAPLPIPVDKLGSAFEVKLAPRICLDTQAISSRVGFDHAHYIDALCKLSEQGYFRGGERAVPLNATQHERCQDIGDRFNTFLGEGGWRVTPSSVVAFLRQFPCRIRDEVTDLLDQVVLLDRTILTPALMQIIRDFANDVDGPVAICRFSPNSGEIVGVLFEADTRNQLEKGGHAFVPSLLQLEGALDGSAKGVVFLDDQFSSGGQARCQLLQWAGVPRDQWPARLRTEKNIRTDKLTPQTTELLKQTPICLGFAMGDKAGAERIETTAKELGFKHLKVQFKRDLPKTSPKMSGDLREFLSHVGANVISYCSGESLFELGEAAQAEFRANALGYGGASSIVVTQFNAPSHMISALWCPGVVGDEPWTPLFLRRGYLEHLVLC